MRSSRKFSAIIAACAMALGVVSFSPAPRTAAAAADNHRKRQGQTPYDNLDYGPFLSASIYATPDNVAWKGIAVKLGENDEGSIAFDTQLLRVSAGWTGGFLKLENVAFTGAHGPSPSVAGDLKFATHNTPGWADKDGNFKDPRIDLYHEPFGGMPHDYLLYKGLYRHGNQVVFSYAVNGADVLESPGVIKAGNDVAFTRTFQLGASKVAQTLAVAAVNGAKGSVGPAGKEGDAQEGDAANAVAVLDKDDQATAAGLVQAPKGATWKIADQNGPTILLTIPPHESAEKFELVVWSGAKNQLSHFGSHLKGSVADVSSLTKGGPAHWTQTFATTGQLAVEPRDKKAAYVLDEIAVPQIPKEWARIEIGGFDFFPDGHTAAVCTWKGDVYLVKNIDDRLDHVVWRRIAGGLFQPLGLKIIDNKIYVHGRDQITVLNDLNNDGEPDFYQNFNNDIAITDHFHEFAFDLQQDGQGNLYIIKGGGVNPGGRGFQEPITRNHGTVMKIAKDGSKLEVVATGFRAPNGMAVTPEGQIVTGDNQGSWTPVDRLNWVKPGGFYGVVELSHRDPKPSVTDNPLMWFPYPGWDNSCGDPVWVSSDKWGPYKGELMYLSYGKCTLMHIMPEEVNGQMQGGAVRFPFRFETGSMRARFNPVDGQLYVVGLKGWQTDARKDAAFERVRYTGQKVYMPTAFHVKDNGLEITFTEPVKKETAADAGAWSIEEWNYRWTSEYGSPEVKVSNPNQQGHDQLEVKSVKVSDDGKTVFLEVDNLQPVMQMLVQGNGIEAADGTPMKIEIANTINTVKGKTLEVGVGKVASR